jgi:succinate dehydrogenase flavin-adding protein (antitoxin of CptAB toxin-antitoxin module)
MPEEASADDTRRSAVNRLLYRAKQRGFLELDLLVGLWAERNVPHLSMMELAAFEEVLDIENPDLFKWLTGQEAAPEALRDNASFMVRAKL